MEGRGGPWGHPVLTGCSWKSTWVRLLWRAGLVEKENGDLLGMSAEVLSLPR